MSFLRMGGFFSLLVDRFMTSPFYIFFVCKEKTFWTYRDLYVYDHDHFHVSL